MGAQNTNGDFERMKKTQLAVYRVIEAFITKHGESPTHKKVAELAVITESWASQQIKSLRIAGYLKNTREWRSIELTEKKPTMPRRALDGANPNTIKLFIKIAVEQQESAEVIDALVTQLFYTTKN